MRIIKTLTVVGVVMLLSMSSNAEDKTVVKPKELKNQTLCPVMGGKIDSTVYTDIQGQRVYHCCPACSAPLKKDPDKFFKEAAEEGVLFENIQTTCPISNMELKEKNIFGDFDGRRIFFCSEDCKNKFAESPQELLNKMDQPSDKKMDQPSQDEDAHKGHNH